MTVGRGGTTTHDYKRHGTTDLFAATNVAAGEVLSDARRSHNAANVLAFSKVRDLHVSKDLNVDVCSTAFRPTRPRRWPNGWPTRSEPDGACTSRRLRRPGCTSSNNVGRTHRRTVRRGVFHVGAHTSSRPSRHGPSAGTTIPSDPSGTRPRRDYQEGATGADLTQRSQIHDPSLVTAYWRGSLEGAGMLAARLTVSAS